MTTTLVLPRELADQLVTSAQGVVETAAVLLARVVMVPSGDMRLLARAIRWMPEHTYTRRESAALEITSDGYVPPLSEAEETGCVPIWFHTHPGDGSSPSPSRHDHVVDAQLSDLFRLRSGSEHYGSLIIAHEKGSLRFSGFTESESGRSAIDRVWVVGSRFDLMQNSDIRRSKKLPSCFDRNIRAFGGDIQRILGQLHVAVVGCGGTGSAVAEQLVRLGVRTLTLVDPDTLSDSNITRVYGSTPSDVGRPKVTVLAEHLQRIAAEVRVTALQSMITIEATARVLTGVDVVFGCTDDNAGRIVLSRFSTFFITPIIDCGVVIDSAAAGDLQGIYGRVTVLHPGAACLVCRNRIDLERARAEMLPCGERARLAGEGYAPALGAVEPAVVVYTTMVAATAVGELLERLIRYGPDVVPSEVLLRIHDRALSSNEAGPRPRHYCHPAAGKLGSGPREPFLELTWQA